MNDGTVSSVLMRDGKLFHSFGPAVVIALSVTMTNLVMSGRFVMIIHKLMVCYELNYAEILVLFKKSEENKNLETLGKLFKAIIHFR